MLRAVGDTACSVNRATMDDAPPGSPAGLPSSVSSIASPALPCKGGGGGGHGREN